MGYMIEGLSLPPISQAEHGSQLAQLKHLTMCFQPFAHYCPIVQPLKL